MATDLADTCLHRRTFRRAQFRVHLPTHNACRTHQEAFRSGAFASLPQNVTGTRSVMPNTLATIGSKYTFGDFSVHAVLADVLDYADTCATPSSENCRNLQTSVPSQTAGVEARKKNL